MLVQYISESKGKNKAKKAKRKGGSGKKSPFLAFVESLLKEEGYDSIKAFCAEKGVEGYRAYVKSAGAKYRSKSSDDFSSESRKQSPLQEAYRAFFKKMTNKACELHNKMREKGKKKASNLGHLDPQEKTNLFNEISKLWPKEKKSLALASTSSTEMSHQELFNDAVQYFKNRDVISTANDIVPMLNDAMQSVSNALEIAEGQLGNEKVIKDLKDLQSKITVVAGIAESVID